MTSKPFVSMPDNIALDFILHVIKPDNQPLGIPFGWRQPSKDDTITLSDLYVGINKTCYIGDILNDNLYPMDLVKNLIRSWRMDCNKKGKLSVMPLELSFIVSNEHISISYSELEREHKLLYHLAIMALNTMTECHNWSISYLEYLAGYYYNFQDHGDNWKVYINENLNQDTIESLNALFEYDNQLSDYFELYGYGYTIDNNISDECYHYFNQWDKKNNDIQDYLRDVIENTDKLDCWDIRSYDVKIISTLAFMIDWIKSEWLEGNLTFELSDNMPRDLYNWYKSYTSQMILPNID